MCFIPRIASIVKGASSIIPDKVLMIPMAEYVRTPVMMITATFDDKHLARVGSGVPL